MTLSEYIKYRLSAANMSQKELAEKLKISSQYLSDLLSDKRGKLISDELLYSIAKAIGCSYTKLFLLAGRLTPDVKVAVEKDIVKAEMYYNQFAWQIGVTKIIIED